MGKSVSLVQSKGDLDIWAGELSDGHVVRKFFILFSLSQKQIDFLLFSII